MAHGTTIQLYNSVTSGNIATDTIQGELAVNIVDGLIYSKNGTETVVVNNAARIHPAVVVASTANFANTSPTTTTLTASAVGITTIDGYALVANDRVLLKNQTLPAENGIYTVSTAGTASVATVLTRAADMNTWAETLLAVVWVTKGTANAGFAYESGTVPTSSGALNVIGTTDITFSSVVSGLSAAAINGGSF